MITTEGFSFVDPSEFDLGKLQEVVIMRTQKLTLDQPNNYEIKVPGIIKKNWMDWNEGISVSVETDLDNIPTTTIRITVDQAGLQGLLRHLYALGLPLISVVRVGNE